MIISNDAEAAFKTTQWPLILKSPNKLGTRENFLNLIKDI